MLQVENIDVHHGDLQVLWGISLEVNEGEMVSLVGSNGAGKSTIVETIAGLIQAQKGKIRFDGVHLNGMPTHKVVEQGVSLIPEDRGIFPGMSVLENLELGAYKPASRKQSAESFEFVYNLFPVLEERQKQAAGTLSGGEQQMVAIGRALMSKPRLLMCDEPSLGLAPIVVKNILRVIQQISDSGVSILLVEQNLKAALSMSNRSYVIENGRVTMHGESQCMLDDDNVKNAYLGTC